MTDSRFINAMLLDFYGALLTDKQRECFDLHYNEDLSLSEIAEQCGISRQGVWDNIHRAESAMQEIETKTGLIRRFIELNEGLDRLSGSLRELAGITEGRAEKLAETALREIEALKG